MSDRIDTMATRFRAADHIVDPVRFALSVLIRKRTEVARALAGGAIVSSLEAAALDVELQDPSDPAPRSRDMVARVNAGRWIADCECGGAEYVDPEMRIAMCCSCWNRADGHRWRGVRLPAEPGRSALEAVLLARPDLATRNWRPGERVRDLERENRGHGLPARRAA